MAAISLYLFGLPRIVYQGKAIEVERRKALALMSYLALADLPQSRDVLATLLWPNLDQEHARGALRSTLYAISSLFPEHWLTVDRQTIRLKRETVWVDVGEFLALLARSRSHPHSPDTLCAECVNLVENHASPIAKSELSKTVQRLRLACEAAISPEQFAAAWGMGKRLNLHAVVVDILKKL
jgi:two-component SAPR family response regulator